MTASCCSLSRWRGLSLLLLAGLVLPISTTRAEDPFAYTPRAEFQPVSWRAANAQAVAAKSSVGDFHGDAGCADVSDHACYDNACCDNACDDACRADDDCLLGNCWSGSQGGHGSAGHERPYRDRADKHLPAGLMGGHMHDAGEVMLEYKFINMYMEDNRFGTRTVGDLESIAIGLAQSPATNAGATPTKMNMEMHMAHLMYGVSERFNVYAMAMLMSNTMDHIHNPMNGMVNQVPRFTTHVSGFSDTVFGALLQVQDSTYDQTILNLAVSVPTGDLTRRTSGPFDGTALDGQTGEFPYPMRLGSGTVNARPALTYRHYDDWGSWGSQFQAILPIGKNFDGYAVSDEYRLNFFAAVVPTEKIALSIRLESLWKTNFDGMDNDLGINPNPPPFNMGNPPRPGNFISTNLPHMRGGYWLNLGLGVSWLLPGGHLLNFEAVPTLYQDVDGIQLEQDWALFASWSKSWGG